MSDRPAVQWSGKMLKNCTTASTHDGINLNVKIPNLEVVPTAQSFLFSQITQKTLNTHVQQNMNTIEVERPKTIEKTEKHTFQEKSSKGPMERMMSNWTTRNRRTATADTPLDLVYDAVMTGQPPYELEGDGWHADEIYKAAGAKWASSRARSTGKHHRQRHEEAKQVRRVAGQFGMLAKIRPSKYRARLQKAMHDGPTARNDAEASERSRSVEVLCALLTNTPTPMARRLAEKPGNSLLLGAGRRASSFRSRVRAVRRFFFWPAMNDSKIYRVSLSN